MKRNMVPEEELDLFLKLAKTLNDLNYALKEEDVHLVASSRHWYGSYSSGLSDIRYLVFRAMCDRDQDMVFHVAKDLMKTNTNGFRRLVELNERSMMPKVAEGHNEKEKKDDHYIYIPFSSSAFCKLMDYSRRFKKKHFLDIGCGAGPKILLAHYFGNFERQSGIEYNESLVNLSKRVLKLKPYPEASYMENRRVHLRDGLEYDYSGYDYIYMYQPMAKRSSMKALYKQVLSTAPIGAIIVNVLHFSDVFYLEEFKFVGKSKLKRYDRYFFLEKVSEDKFRVIPVDEEVFSDL